MRFLVGIDDTDALDSRGTGYRARMLAEALSTAGLAVGAAITRHQLLVDPRIPYTSHNSSACIEVEASADDASGIEALGRDYLVRESAPGSDAGLCLAAWDDVTLAIEEFGARAKTEIVTQEEAKHLAGQVGLVLHGLTGTGGGIIGALAAVGLRRAGNDGRFLSLPGLRELQGTYTAAELERVAHVTLVMTATGRRISGDDRIDVGEWPRPLLQDGQAVLLVEETGNGTGVWVSAPKEIVKRLSD